jgi:hypothetical protein
MLNAGISSMAEFEVLKLLSPVCLYPGTTATQAFLSLQDFPIYSYSKHMIVTLTIPCETSFLFIFDFRSCFVMQDDLELTIIPQLPYYWNYRHGQQVMLFVIHSFTKFLP